MNESAHEAIALRRAQSLTDIVRNELERLIINGELSPGERLNEQGLAHRYGVSRGPVREAMRALERAQLVSFRLNQGFFVRDISPEEISEVYDIRAVVYGFVSARLAEIITAEEIEVLEGYIPLMDAAIAANDLVEYYRLNLEFHDETIRMARHGCAAQTYQTLINETHLTRKRALSTPDRMMKSNDEHRAWIAALKARDIDLARRLGEEHALAGRRRWEDSLPNAGEPHVSNSSAGGDPSDELQDKIKKA